jgi:hypothetical protein
VFDLGKHYSIECACEACKAARQRPGFDPSKPGFDYSLWLVQMWRTQAPIGIGDVRGRVAMEITSRKDAMIVKRGGVV